MSDMMPMADSIKDILARYPQDESSLVMLLQDVQSRFNFLPCEALEAIATWLKLPLAQIFSTATFYKAFSLSPQGKVIINVCKGTACHVKGASLFQEELERSLNLEHGVENQTTADGLITLRTVNCVGACAMAPVVTVDDKYYGEVSSKDAKRIIRRAKKVAESDSRSSSDSMTKDANLNFFKDSQTLAAHIDRVTQAKSKLRAQIRVCGGPGCLAAGSNDVYHAFKEKAEELAKSDGRMARLDIRLADCLDSESHDLLSLTGCQGLCQQGPLVHFLPEDTFYTRVKTSDVEMILRAKAANEVLQERLGETKGRYAHPFYQKQKLLALRYCGQVNPTDLDDYLASGGFQALIKVLKEKKTQRIVDKVEKSKLRGRGGAGFSTGRKWKTALKAAKDRKLSPYILCNGDEGDPGAFMDRAIMEGSPYAVIEGMMIGGYALGAKEGYLYVRYEYPLAIERLKEAIDRCMAANLLGEHILGAAFSFSLQISVGGGAFVCGESTALMRSIEGKVGEPRAKYTRSAERGLWDAPTVLNNVETWALIPEVILDAGDKEGFSSLGTKGSTGTKAFSLTGAVKRTGLVEVEMGTTLKELVEEIGGGALPNRTLKAVQTGGPSGGCIPASMFDLAVDFDALDQAGSMMGSGGMIVMDDHSCMVDIARYFVDFLMQESCGKCVPCRLGLPQLATLLTKVSSGEAIEADLDEIEDIAQTMATSSLCGLGKSAPNPVLSTLRYFKDEYLAHLRGQCPAGVCRPLLQYHITEDCNGCQACLKACPTQTITGKRNELHHINLEGCTQCGLCLALCNYEAIEILSAGQVVVSAKPLSQQGAQ